MFCGPEVMRRRSEATSSASVLWSYLTSSGPKHFVQTYCAVSSYSVPHSRQARFVTAMRKLLGSSSGVLPVCDEEVASYATRLQELAPSRLSGGCRGFIGPVPPPLWTCTAMSSEP